MAKAKLVASWVWGEYCRSLLAALPRLRPRLDEATRERFAEQLHEVGHEEESGRGADELCTCALCGRWPSGVGLVIARSAAGARPAFTWGDESEPLDARCTLLCRLCLHRFYLERDDDLRVIRGITAELPEAARYLAMFDTVVEARIVRRVEGRPCVICEKRGKALNGVRAVVCLACHGRAQEVFRAALREERAGQEARHARYEREIVAFRAALHAVAVEEARCALQARDAEAEERDAVRARELPEPPSPMPAHVEPRDVPRPEEALGERFREALRGEISPSALARAVGARWWPGRAQASGARAEGDEAPTRALRGDDRPRRPSAEDGERDRRAEAAIAFLEAEVERALRHQPGDRDLLGDRSKIARVIELLVDALPPRRALLERLLVLVSMLRQLMKLGVVFYDHTGDELIDEEIGAYRAAADLINVGLGRYAQQAEEHGTLVIAGGTREKRAAAASEIQTFLRSRYCSVSPPSGAPAMQYVEEEDLYAMPEEQQAEIRRRMLITPPVITLLGTDSVERFMAEAPGRAKVRLVTYFFLSGQPPLDLDRRAVHVTRGLPALPRPVF